MVEAFAHFSFAINRCYTDPCQSQQHPLSPKTLQEFLSTNRFIHFRVPSHRKSVPNWFSDPTPGSDYFRQQLYHEVTVP